ncbi:MAG: hypothetical protein ABIK73_07225 [candidate division WOR-3 bacterium]
MQNKHDPLFDNFNNQKSASRKDMNVISRLLYKFGVAGEETDYLSRYRRLEPESTQPPTSTVPSPSPNQPPLYGPRSVGMGAPMTSTPPQAYVPQMGPQVMQTQPTSWQQQPFNMAYQRDVISELYNTYMILAQKKYRTVQEQARDAALRKRLVEEILKEATRSVRGQSRYAPVSLAVMLYEIEPRKSDIPDEWRSFAAEFFRRYGPVAQQLIRARERQEKAKQEDEAKLLAMRKEQEEKGETNTPGASGQ